MNGLKQEIYLIFSSFYLGGTELRWLKILSKINNQFSFRAVLLNPNNELQKKLVELAISCHDFSGPSKAVSFFKIVYLIVAKKCPVAITFGAIPSMFLRIIKLVKWDMKTITVVPGMDNFKNKNWIQGIDKASSFLSNRYLFNSFALQRDYAVRLGLDENRSIVIRNGIVARLGAIREMDAKRETVNLISVGNFREIKNQIFLLKVLKELNKSSEYAFSLTLIGDGVLKNSLVQFAAENNLKNVSFMGFQEQVYSFLEESHIYLCSSFYEGMPNSVMEAMNVGLPILAPRTGGLPELVDHGFNGFLIDNWDISTWVSHVKKIINDKETYVNLSANSRLKIQTEFNFTSMISQTQSFLLSL